MTWKSLLACSAWAFAMLGYWLLAGCVVFSQETSTSKPMQYRKVFVPSADLPLLGSDFVPIKINELEQLLASHREQTKLPLDPSTPVLTQSLLVASLVDNDLVSSASRVTITCQTETPRLYTFSPFSLAARATTASQQKLAVRSRPGIAVESQPFRYDGQGRPTITIQEPTDYWFGWSLRGKPAQDISRLQFKLEVPRCLDSRLLLKLPPMWSVESESNVARPSEDPIALLGNDWPSNFDFDGELDSENWWFVELSGSTSVSFDLVQSVDAFQLKFDRLVSQERIDYRLLPGTLEVVSEFQLSNSLDAFSDLKIRLDPGLHISSVTLDEEPLEWQPSQVPFCIDVLYGGELDDPDVSPHRRLVVRGLAVWPRKDEQSELPTIQIEKAFSIDGVGSLSIHPDWAVNQVTVDKGRIFSRSGTTQLGGLGRCDFEWTRSAPKISLHATPRSRQGRTETWTRLSNDNDGLVATSWVGIGATANPRSSLRVTLSPGWTIESVQSTERRFMTTVHRVPNADNSEWQIQIAPAVENQAITLEIRTRNNSITKSDIANSTDLVFDGERPITFHDLKQSDFYWIEPTGRYKVDANAELLQCQIDLSTLTESQRQHLPRIGGVRLMKLDGRKLPRLTFRRQPAPFTAQLETALEPSLLGVSAHYRLKCIPIAGAVSSVTIDVPDSEDVSIRWRQRRNTSDSNDLWVPVESINVRRDNRKNPPKSAKSSGVAARTVQVSLPTAMSEEFELEGFADFPRPHPEATKTRIPLLSLPEAAQKVATLQVDERLALAQTEESNPWTPFGYIRFKSDTAAFRFRYDPIQLVAVDIQMSQQHRLPSVCLDDVVWQLRRYLDGQNEFDIQARLIADEATAIGFQVQHGWRLRKALLDDQIIHAIESSEDANHVQIWIPRRVSAQTTSTLKMIFDGPPSIIQHRETVAFPVIEPTCTVLNQRYELWLPSAMSIQVPSTESLMAFPSLDFAKLLPSRWMQLLFQDFPSRPIEHQTMQEHRFDRDENLADTSQLVLAMSTGRVTEIQTRALHATILSNHSEQAENWVVVFAGFALSLCLAHLRKSHLAIIGLILAFGIIATNGHLLENLQLGALGWIVSVVLVVINACYKPRERISDQTYFSGVGQGSRSKISRVVHSKKEGLSLSKTKSKFFAMWIGGGVVLVANFIDSAPAMAQAQADKAYHVVLPLDSNNELTSEVAYVSGDFLQELYQHRKTRELATQFLSARYELHLVESALRNANESAHLTIRYEIDVRDLRQPIILPLQAKQARFVSLLVDGSEIPLGSRLRWDEQVLQWMPPNRGLTQIELTVEANLNRGTEGRSGIEVDVIPFAGARLDIATAEMIDVQCDAAGQVFVPSDGNLQAALGPKSKLKASWRKPEKELRVAAPTAMVESEFVLVGQTVLARTTIDVDDSSLGIERFDIECDSAWQPLGRRWGNATLLDSLPASSNTRRRYRLRWEDPGSGDRNLRSTVIHWAAGSSSATLMNLPEIEVIGTRVQENLIRFVRQKNSEWQFEGLQSWTKVDAGDPFTWLPRVRGESASFRKPFNAPSAFLRRASKIEYEPVTLESQLRFHSNEVYCRTTVTRNQGASYGPDIRLTLPADVIVQSVRANQIEIPFSVLQIDDHRAQLQAFLDPDSDTVGAIVIESIQRYGDAAWMLLPLPTLDTYPVADHSVSATRIVGQTIELEGIETQAPRTSIPLSATGLDQTQLSMELPAWIARLRSTPKTNLDGTTTQDSLQALSSDAGPRYRILHGGESNQGYVVTQLSRNDQGWNFRVHGLVEAGANPIDGVLTEMPLSIWENLHCKHRTIRYESPEANRVLVYFFSDDSSSNKPFEFEFNSSLPPTESNATTELPEVRLLGDFEWQQWLTVPRTLANQEARWSFSGARSVDASTVPEFAMSDLPDLANESLVVVPTTDRPNVRLSNIAANPLPIALNLAIHESTMNADSLRNMRSSFFFVPRGQLSIRVQLPLNRSLLSVECNGHRVPMNSIHFETTDESNSQFRVGLFSSSLPQKITLHTSEIRGSNRMDLGMGGLPEVVNITPERSLLIVDSPDGLTGMGSKSVEIDQARQLMASSVVSVVEKASGFIAESSLTERRQWWRDWEDSTAAIWHEASHIKDHDFLNETSERRNSLTERLQLRTLSLLEPPTLSPIRPIATQVAESFPGGPFDRNVRQYFLIDPEFNSASKIPIRALGPRKINWLNSNVWFGWSLWLVTTILTLRFARRRFDTWIVPLKQYFLHRPWSLLVAFGLLAFALAPSSWYGPGFIAISLFSVIRTYWHEASQVT